LSQRWKTFENVVAKELSSWLFGDPKILRRSPCSGGWRGRGEDGDIILAADNSELDKENPFSFEAKCRVESGCGETGWHFEQLLTSKKHPILSWWYQVSTSAPVKGGKLRMLIFSKSSGIAHAYIGLGLPEVQFVESAGVLLTALPKMVFFVGRSEDPNIQTEVLHFFNFREFIDYVDAGLLRRAWRSNNGVSTRED
jgi:hypothetical protein